MYREVTMVEVKEVLRLWRAGVATKQLAAQLGLDPKTARRELRAAEAAGLRREGPPVSHDDVREVLLALEPTVGGRGGTAGPTVPPSARRSAAGSLPDSG